MFYLFHCGDSALLRHHGQYAHSCALQAPDVGVVKFLNNFEEGSMRTIVKVFVCAVSLGIGSAHADQVIEEVPDTLPGKGYGGLVGIMAGAAMGGPIGAIAAGFAGAWAGGQTQDALGMSGRAYRVKRDDGRTVVVRSPGNTLSPGDSVEIVDKRLRLSAGSEVSTVDIASHAP